MMNRKQVLYLAAIASIVAMVLAFFSTGLQYREAWVRPPPAVTDPSCDEAQKELLAASRLISPLFPDFLCVDPGSGRKIEPTEVAVATTNASDLVAACKRFDLRRGKELEAKLLLIPIQASLYTTKPSEPPDEKIRANIARLLGGNEHPLTAFRELEVWLNRLDRLTWRGKSSCQSREDGEEWRSAVSSAEQAFRTAAAGVRMGQYLGDPREALGCAWMMRAELSSWRAGTCAEDQFPEPARLAESLVSLRRASELTSRPVELAQAFSNNVYPLTQDTLAQGRLAEDADRVVRGDSDLLGDRGLANRRQNVENALGGLLGDDARQFEWLRITFEQLIAHQRGIGGSLAEGIFQLADLDLNYGKPEEALRLLRENVGVTPSDYRRAVLEGRALCFSGRYAESLSAFDAAANSVPSPSLEAMSRWGVPGVLRILCEVGTGRRDTSDLGTELIMERSKLMRQGASPSQALADLCTLKFQAPDLLAKLHERDTLEFMASDCK